MSEINHILITRMNYKDKDLLRTRIEITKEILISCLKSQTNQNFKWAIVSPHSDVEFFRKELDFPFIPLEVGADKNFLRTGGFHIQTRHDDDDWMAADYIDKIQQIYLDNFSRYKRFIIHFQPTKLSYSKRIEYAVPEYHSRRISMFASLCQPSAGGKGADDDVGSHGRVTPSSIDKTVVDRPHIHLHELSRNIIKVPMGYVKLMIHDNNLLSAFKERDIPLPKNAASENANHLLDFEAEYANLFDKYMTLSSKLFGVNNKNAILESKVSLLENGGGLKDKNSEHVLENKSHSLSTDKVIQDQSPSQIRELKKSLKQLRQDNKTLIKAIERWNRRNWFSRAIHKLRVESPPEE